MDELTIGDKIYISSKRAAEITGYAKDYIGQLCREGRVEATLVGRSWYVLESSIRNHRFGVAEDQNAVADSVGADASDELSSWTPPIYKAEEVPEVPILERRSVNILENQAAVPVVEPKTASIEDMQAAWKEWFATRNQEEKVVSAEEPVKEDEESAPEPLEAAPEPVYMAPDPIPSTPEIEEPIQIHREYSMPVQEPVYIAPTQSVSAARPTARRRRKKGSSLALKALLVSVALLVAAVAVINLGITDTYAEKNGIEYEPLRFLGGTRILNK